MMRFLCFSWDKRVVSHKKADPTEEEILSFYSSWFYCGSLKSNTHAQVVIQVIKRKSVIIRSWRNAVNHVHRLVTCIQRNFTVQGANGLTHR